jgi:hypothetical protein
MKDALDAYGIVPDRGRCAATGKISWPTRRHAKKVARRVNPGEHMSAYRCASCGAFHVGHLPAGVARGTYSRDDLRTRGEA